jgi:hypothetical protein
VVSTGPEALQEFLRTSVIVVTSECLVWVDDRKSRGAGGDCESDSNKYEDFFHDRILSKQGSLNRITATQVFATGIVRERNPRNYSDKSAFRRKADTTRRQ